MINLRNYFNTNNCILLLLLTFILFIILTVNKENLNRLGKMIIYTSISILIIHFIVKIIIKTISNNIVKIFLIPILNNMNNNIFIYTIISLLIGIILQIFSKKNKIR